MRDRFCQILRTGADLIVGSIGCEVDPYGAVAEGMTLCIDTVFELSIKICNSRIGIGKDNCAERRAVEEAHSLLFGLKRLALNLCVILNNRLQHSFAGRILGTVINASDSGAFRSSVSTLFKHLDLVAVASIESGIDRQNSVLNTARNGIGKLTGQFTGESAYEIFSRLIRI